MKETIEKLASVRDRLRKSTFAVLIALLASLALTMFGKRILGMILGVCVMVFFFGWQRRKNRGFSDMVAEASILNGLTTPLKNPKFLGDSGLTAEELEKLAILPIQTDNHGLLARQGFEGHDDGGTCRGWETTFHYQRSARRTDFAFLSGTLMTKAFDSPLSVKADWVAVRREALASGIQEQFFRDKGYAVLQTENEEFDREFLVGVRDGGILPENVVPRIAGITKRLEQIAAIRCTDCEAAVFLDHRFYTPNMKIRDLPTEDQLKQNPLPERDDIWELFRFFQREDRKEEQA